jgi:hypothetical protein
VVVDAEQAAELLRREHLGQAERDAEPAEAAGNLFLIHVSSFHEQLECAFQ